MGSGSRRGARGRLSHLIAVLAVLAGCAEEERRATGPVLAAAGPLVLDGACTTDASCDDGKPCTVDICNPSTKVCDHPKLQNSCCSDADCAPIDPCHVGVCDLEAARCQQESVPGAWCCTTSADCGESAWVCKENVCDKGVCHAVDKAGCCVSDADCKQPGCNPTGTCNLQSHACEYGPPPWWNPTSLCKVHNDCHDASICTDDFCINGCCVHEQKPECCEVSGAVDDPHCDDYNACTSDVCADNQCKHLPSWPLGGQPPLACCQTVADCPDPGAPGVVTLCLAHTCVSVEVSDLAELPYSQPFDAPAGSPPSALDMKPIDLGAAPKLSHWSIDPSPVPAFSATTVLRYHGGLDDHDVESCVQTPAVATASATSLHVSWRWAFRHRSAAAPVTLRLEVVDWLTGAPPGALEVLWEHTATGPIPPQQATVEVESPSPFLGDGHVRLRLCVKTANTWGDWDWLVDDLLLAAGHPPQLARPLPLVVDAGSTRMRLLTASDPDGDPLAFSLSGVPPFVALGAATPLSETGWSAPLVASPPPSAPGGAHSLTATVDDGLVTATVPVRVVVRRTDGVLVWAPAGGTPGAAEALHGALLAAGQSPQILHSLWLHPDLTPFSAVFVTLGAWPHTHALTQPEADRLAAYVAAGGRLYVEGSDAFGFAPVTSLSPLLGVAGATDGATLTTLTGAGPLESTAFTVAPSPLLTASVDHLTPAPSATPLLTTGGATVLLTSGSGPARTVASSVLFAAVDQGAPELLAAIMAHLLAP